MQQPQGEMRWQSMTDNPLAQNTQAQSMGERLAATRRRLGLSQRRVAELSGLTHGAICMIEQDKVSPSVASLQKLLSVYELPLSRFFAEEEVASTPSVVIRAEQLIELGSQGVSMKLVHNGNNRRQLGFMLETYAPGTDTGGQVTHLGEEVGTVLEGSVILTVAGQTYQLSAGDSYVIDTGEPHSFSNPSGQVCRIVSAHTPANF
ncbi:HTH-type transcriptional regulator PuuR [Aeromonas dhakensis]|uniref:HTH-type transcriptional regulator PuuR n=1 Tax=Aeromonas TaxID=642 RepID=UPI00029B55DC|nr:MULTISPECIES: HTH-type transcriptional regulator PuuR [Aeromonas]MBL0534686.1 HTH-type transcriptional regulator PuuR [Aeromonas dhakensis]MBQ4674039.1 HTH-type transcriptional regulator PuuR [Aeromonas dhakensis]MDH0174601.1 HTH-type transcriptional regulator PuuR [Aeromonas dhakensis]QXA15198.1 HTH-type transcriptional regulator PuuR [Aeromonas sp. FDAARGOS 1403]RFS28646.1 HTH-type transcriptional regulator PuuR [Aeromonas dhakensis]